MDNPHEIQKSILKNLLVNKELRFSGLNSTGISSDRFTFHLKALVEQGIVRKDDNGLYRLTSQGKEYANRFDIDSQEMKIERQAKVAVLVIARDGDKYLVQQRLKEPSYGYHGFVTGKIKWAETVLEAAGRELMEETGLKGRLTLRGIEHKMDYSRDGVFLEDKFFNVVKATGTCGKLIEAFGCGKNFWLTKKQITELPEIFDDVYQLMEIVDQNNFIFKENKFFVQRY